MPTLAHLRVPQHRVYDTPKLHPLGGMTTGTARGETQKVEAKGGDVSTHDYPEEGRNNLMIALLNHKSRTRPGSSVDR